MANLEVKDLSYKSEIKWRFWGGSENFIIILFLKLLLVLIRIKPLSKKIPRSSIAHNSVREMEFSEHEPLLHPRLASLGQAEKAFLAASAGYLARSVKVN